jgi:hypothetical protein
VAGRPGAGPPPTPGRRTDPTVSFPLCPPQESESWAYAFTAVVPAGAADAQCPPIPKESGLYGQPDLRPISLRQHGDIMDVCMVSGRAGTRQPRRRRP